MKRRRFTPEFEAQGVLEVLTGVRTVQPLGRKPPPAPYLSQKQVDLAPPRQCRAQMRACGKAPRAAVEATVGAIKILFGSDKAPVRGKFRMCPTAMNYLPLFEAGVANVENLLNLEVVRACAEKTGNRTLILGIQTRRHDI